MNSFLTRDIDGPVFGNSVVPMIVHDKSGQEVVEIPTAEVDALNMTEKDFLENF